MCDDLTAQDEERWLAARGLNRREFAALSAAGALSGLAAGESQAAKVPQLNEAMVVIPTPDGNADAFFVHPAKGSYPAVIMWPDIAGLREAYKQMGRRLAAAGYAVLVVNHYYRAGPAPFVAAMIEWRTPAGQERLKPAIQTLSPERAVRDAVAIAAWLDRQKSVARNRKMGTQGYCQTGSFALRAAAALPGRIGAAASFHGGGLVSERADSPHRLLVRSKASFLIAIARNDDTNAPGEKETLRSGARQAGRKAEIEVYGADHGWCTLDSPVYDKAEADRAWARLLALYKRL